MTIGQRIKEKRIELGWSQEELAKRMGYRTRNAIYQCEQAENMKLSKISKFAEVLGCSEFDLIGPDEAVASEINDDVVSAIAGAQDDEELRALAIIAAFAKGLNEEGFKELLKRAEELNELNKYKKDDNK